MDNQWRSYAEARKQVLPHHFDKQRKNTKKKTKKQKKKQQKKTKQKKKKTNKKNKNKKRERDLQLSQLI